MGPIEQKTTKLTAFILMYLLITFIPQVSVAASVIISAKISVIEAEAEAKEAKAKASALKAEANVLKAEAKAKKAALKALQVQSIAKEMADIKAENEEASKSKKDEKAAKEKLAKDKAAKLEAKKVAEAKKAADVKKAADAKKAAEAKKAIEAKEKVAKETAREAEKTAKAEKRLAKRQIKVAIRVANTEKIEAQREVTQLKSKRIAAEKIAGKAAIKKAEATLKKAEAVKLASKLVAKEETAKKKLAATKAKVAMLTAKKNGTESGKTTNETVRTKALEIKPTSKAKAETIYTSAMLKRVVIVPGIRHSKQKTLQDGEFLYKKYCASCHRNSGEGFVGKFPPLKGLVINRKTKDTYIRLVLLGSTRNPMHSFRKLTDYEIASVMSYVNTSWNNKGPVVRPANVQSFRKTL